MSLRRRLWLGLGIGTWVAVSASAAELFPEVQRVVLWAWDRPQQLSMSLPGSVWVAVLYQHIELSGKSSSASQPQKTILTPQRRRNALRLNMNTKVMPVVHVQIDNLYPPTTLSHEQIEQVVGFVYDAARVSNSGWVQLDFEARPSQRDDYLNILKRLQPLRKTHHLSVTALASWCMRDTWLDASLVDEVVPMLFRMGKGKQGIQEWIARERQLPVSACRSSVGWMFGEPWQALQGMRSMYVFHPRSWKNQDIENVMSTTGIQ